MLASNTPKPTWQPLAAIFAWIIPGAGHFLCGQRLRGIILALAIYCLFLTGLLIGGISSIDRKENTLWFYAQTFAGPATFAVDRWHQSLKQPARDILIGPFAQARTPDYAKLPYVQSLGRVNELGTLFCAIAGLLNLLTIIDVLYFRPPGNEILLADDSAIPGTGRILTRENTP